MENSENFEQTRPSSNLELGKTYIQNAALAAQKGERLWQIDDEKEVLSAASTKETDDSILVTNIGSISSGKGRELLGQIARYAKEKDKNLLVSATFDSESYYERLGFVYVNGSNNVWSIDPKELL